MVQTISFNSFVKKIIFITTFIIALLFGVYGYFIQSGSIKQNLESETSLMVDLIFENLYTAMKSGATKNDLDNIIINIEKKLPNSSVSLYKNKYDTPSTLIKEVFENKESEFFTTKSYINFARPIFYQKECLACHTGHKEDEIAAVIQLEFSIFDLNVSLKDILVMIFILFLISIVVIFTVWYIYLNRYFIKPIKGLIVQMLDITEHKHLKNKILIDTKIKEIKEIETVFNDQNKNLSGAYETLESLSNTDALTGIYNRRMFDKTIEQEISLVQRYNYNLSILLIDLNKFKPINDTYGHDAGDLVLVEFAKTISQNIRKTDKFFRIGGDEFIIILPHSKKDEVEKLVSKLKKKIEENKIKYEDIQLTISASFGIAQYSDETKDSKSLLQVADEMMYEDKRQNN